MVRKPKVELYLLTEEEGPRRLFVYGGVSVAKNHLLSFSYKFAYSGEDSGSFSLAFTEPNVILDPFRRGSYIGVEWGYEGGPTTYQEVAIEKLFITYTKRGLIIKVSFISIAGFQDKYPDLVAKREDASKKKPVSIVFSFFNPITEQLTEVTLTPEEGNKIDVKNSWPTGMGPFPTIKEDIEQKKKLGSISPGGAYSSSVVPGLGPGSFAEGTSLKHHLSKKDRIDLTDRTATRLLKWMTKLSNDFFVGARDRAFLVTTDIAKRPPLFAILPKAVLGVTFKELPKKLATEYVSSISFDPKTKKLSISDSLFYTGIDYQVGEGDSARFFRVYKKGKKFGFTVKSTKKGVPDAFVPLTTDQEEVFQTTLKKLGGDQFLERAKLVYENKATWELFNTADRWGGFYRPDDTRKITIWNKAQKGSFVAEDFGPVGSKAPITYRLSPDSILNQVNVALQDQAVSFYNNTGAQVVLEGNPSLSLDFNFRLKGFSGPLNGIYVALSTTHTINGKDYKTTILGGFIPQDLKKKVESITKGEDSVKKIVEKFGAINTIQTLAFDRIYEIAEPTPMFPDLQKFKYNRKASEEFLNSFDSKGGPYRAPGDLFELKPEVHIP